MAMVWALANVFKWRLLSRFMLRLAFQLLSMISPLLIFNFTEFVEKNDELLTSEDFRMAAITACGIIGLDMIEHFGHAIFDYHMTIVSTLAGKSLKVMIFSKNFRMSSTGKRNYTFAQVLNLVNTESYKVWEMISMVSDIVMTPFEIAYCAFFIYYYLGWSVLSGLALWLLRFAIVRLFKGNKVEYYAKV